MLRSSIRHGAIVASAADLHGSHIFLDMVSVGATINIMMAASMARGNTTIENAAERAARCRCGELPEQHGEQTSKEQEPM